MNNGYSRKHAARNNRLKKTIKPKKTIHSSNMNQIICCCSFFAGLILAVLMINIYRITIISWKPSFYASLAIGLLLTIITRSTKYVMDNFPKNNIAYLFFYYTIAVGIPSNYLFFALNYYFAYPKITYYSFLIKEKSSMPGPKGHRNERQPLVRFNYFGEGKELVFSYSQTLQVMQAKKVLVRIKRGRLGFDIVSSQELL